DLEGLADRTARVPAAESLTREACRWAVRVLVGTGPLRLSTGEVEIIPWDGASVVAYKLPANSDKPVEVTADRPAAGAEYLAVGLAIDRLGHLRDRLQNGYERDDVAAIGRLEVDVSAEVDPAGDPDPGVAVLGAPRR